MKRTGGPSGVRILNIPSVALSISLCVLAGAFTVSCSKSRTGPIYKGKPLSEWAMMTQDQNLDFGPSAKALEAMQAIREIGPRAIPYLLQWIQPPCWDSRLPGGAVESLRVLGPQAKSAIPDLARLLDKYKPPTSMDGYSAWSSAVEALSYLGPESLPILLTAATNLHGVHEQGEIIERIGNLGTNAVPAIPALISWTRDQDEWVRLGAVNALAQIGQEPGTVVPVFLGLLDDPDQLVRRDAAEGLGAFGEDARSASPELIKALEDPEWNARTAAIMAPSKAGDRPEVVVPLLAQRLHDENWIIRRCAAFALGNVGGKTAFDALMSATDDSEGFVREAVFQSLKRIDPVALAKSGKKLH